MGYTLHDKRAANPFAIQEVKGNASVVSRIENGQTQPVELVRKAIHAIHNKVKFGPAELRDLGYRYLMPSDVETDLASPQLIAAIVPRIDYVSFWNIIVGSLHQRALDNNHLVLLFHHKESKSLFKSQLEALEQTVGLNGLIIAPPHSLHRPPKKFDIIHKDIAASIIGLWKRDVPTVFIDRQMHMPGFEIPYIGIDNVDAGKRATDALVSCGHKRIGALFSGPITTQLDREKGYKASLCTHEIPYDKELVEFVPDLEAEADDERNRAGVDAAIRLIVVQKPTALFCGTYYLALSVLSAVAAINNGEQDSNRHISIPKDLSLIGFDAVPELNLPERKIARVHYSLDLLTKTAFETLLALCNDMSDSNARKGTILNKREIHVTPKGSIAAPRNR
jgi:DNA-binding LacI/PurR family transcriptional regulator